MERVTPDQGVFRATDYRIIADAVATGVGIGFMSDWAAERYSNVTQLFPPQESWVAPLWLVTHVDLHRTTKVQAFLNFLKDEAKSW